MPNRPGRGHMTTESGRSGLLCLASFNLLVQVLLMTTKFNMINYLSQAVQLENKLLNAHIAA